MKCYIVQHGDALNKEDNPDRPLSEDGRDDFRRWRASYSISVFSHNAFITAASFARNKQQILLQKDWVASGRFRRWKASAPTMTPRGLPSN